MGFRKHFISHNQRKKQIKKSLSEIADMDPDERIEARIEKYARMGDFLTVSAEEGTGEKSDKKEKKK